MKMNRRQLLQTGSLAMLGLGLPALLRAEQAAGRQRRSGRSCIFIVQYGGASQIDTLDPKPAAPDDVRGPYRPIATATPGLRISDMLPRLAPLSRHYCVVRSMTHARVEHGQAMDVCLTGQSTPPPGMPTMGSVTTRLKPSRGMIPSYVWIQDLDRDVSRAYLTGGTLGQQHGPMLIAARQENFAASGFRVKAFDASEGITTARAEERLRLLGRLEADAPILQQSGPADLQRFQEQALALTRGEGAAQAFDVTREPESLRDRYGRHPFGQNLLAARRLIEAGVRLVSVNAWCGVPDGEEFKFTQGWDHHGAPSQKGGIFSNTQHGLGFVLPRFDQALAALLEDLHQRGLLASTLVVVVGEFGRTPRIRKNHFEGRDHWPQCFSALLAGGGIRGGAVWGKSDKEAAYVQDKPVVPEDFAATIYQALGISYDDRLTLGARLPVINGQVIKELLG